MKKKLIGLFVLICVLVGASRKYNLFSMNESDDPRVKEYHERLKAAQENPQVQKELLKRLEKASDWARRSTKQSGICPLSKKFINFLLGGGPITLKGANSGVFSPDSSKLATGANDNTIATIWDVKTGALQQAWDTGNGQVMSVAFSPDGSTLATGLLDNTVKIWDVKTGKLLHDLTGRTDFVTPVASNLNVSVAFSPDGSKLVSGPGEKTAKIWDTNTGALLYTLTGHTDMIKSVAFSPDGSKLATGSEDNSTKIWDTNTGALLHTLTAHNAGGWFNLVVFSPDGSKLVTGFPDNGLLKVWDVETGALQHEYNLQNHTGGFPESVAFSPDGSELVAGGHNGVIEIWDVNTSALHSVLEGNNSTVVAVAFSPDGSKLATGTAEVVQIWDVKTGQLLHGLTRHTDRLNSVAFSPDSSKLVVISQDTVMILDMHRLEKISELQRKEQKEKGKNEKIISLQRFLKVLPDKQCEKDSEYCNIMSVEQCELLQAFQNTFEKDPQTGKPIGRIQATQAQWQIFKSLPEILQEILQNRIKKAE